MRERFTPILQCAQLWCSLILKWENRADNAHSDRWLVLIAFIVGLSIGVHLLNLLCIPAIVLVYVYKHNPNLNAKGSLLALLVSFIMVGVVLYGVVPGIVKVGGWFELLFVNGLGFNFNTGMIVYLVILIACVIWAIFETQRDKNRKAIAISTVLSVALLGIPFFGDGIVSILFGIVVIIALFFVLKLKGKKAKYVVSARAINTTLLCFLMLMIGYSSFAIMVIRSTANPPMDQNSPEDIFTLGSYLNREQYGSWPLFYGQAYTSQPQYVETVMACFPGNVRKARQYIIARKRKARTRRTPMWLLGTTINTNTPRICFSHACIRATMPQRMKVGWAE